MLRDVSQFDIKQPAHLRQHLRRGRVIQGLLTHREMPDALCQTIELQVYPMWR